MLANVLRLPVETSPQSQGISGYVASVAKKIWTNKANANTVVFFFFFFFHCGHAECDLFCQLVLFLDANAVSVSFALEGTLPVEASFWNRSIVCFLQREQLESGAGSVRVCPGSFTWCAYGGKWADLPRAERKGLTLIQENQWGQKWR